MVSRLAIKSKQRHAKTVTQALNVSEIPPSSVDFSMENRLSTQEAAHYLGIRAETLARWRSERRLLEIEQPNFYRIGKKITYLRHDLNTFLLRRGEASLAILRMR